MYEYITNYLDPQIPTSKVYDFMSHISFLLKLPILAIAITARFLAAPRDENINIKER